ncbi:hypothetical protein M752DRAFT_48763 [Aspergillus phoenicis ATCC 13157]|uniref:Uncharacterized protein n=2 Tax=Aspergillus TaxID=5052 RepID=A0A370PD29_ASPPH|nr:hypothetical protein M747DRAFT_36049 [Aspergillus niger ATCC 13496]RDK40103.1 hypothetical protein M752DRAFT_48763 [Aspergillus phoenicis ATCC 13157]
MGKERRRKRLTEEKPLRHTYTHAHQPLTKKSPNQDHHQQFPSMPHTHAHIYTTSPKLVPIHISNLKHNNFTHLASAPKGRQ